MFPLKCDDEKTPPTQWGCKTAAKLLWRNLKWRHKAALNVFFSVKAPFLRKVGLRRCFSAFWLVVDDEGLSPTLKLFKRIKSPWRNESESFRCADFKRMENVRLMIFSRMYRIAFYWITKARCFAFFSASCSCRRERSRSGGESMERKVKVSCLVREDALTHSTYSWRRHILELNCENKITKCLPRNIHIFRL